MNLVLVVKQQAQLDQWLEKETKDVVTTTTSDADTIDQLNQATAAMNVGATASAQPSLNVSSQNFSSKSVFSG